MGNEVEEGMEEVNEDPAILRAAASKDWDLVRSLAEKCDVDATGSDWQKTALYYAAEEGQADLVSLLLDKGANGNMKPFGHSDFTVLHRAAEQGHEDVVRLLLARGGAADLGVTDNGGETPLSLAVLGGHAGVVATLLAAGARVGVTESQQGRTPLHLAAVNGHVDVARQLLDAGSDINATDYEAGRTPLMLAAETGRVKMVDLLLQKSCDVMMGTVYREKNYIGSYLDFNNHPEAGDTTIHADDGATALHLAAQRGWVDVVELLLAKQPSLLQCRTRRGYTVLHYAAVGGGYDVVEMLLKKHRDSLDAEAVSEEGRTPLHDVVYSSPYDKVEERSRTSRAECIRLLVEAGWKVDAATKDGLTPLHVLADSNCYGGDRAAIARYLLDAGCDPNARTVDGRSALCLTSYPLDFHELLLERGCRVTVRDLQGAADLANYSVFKLLHSRLPASEWDPSAVDEDGSTLLHLAAQGCDTELLELLLDLGCDASARRRDGKTALHCSAQYISPSTLQLLVDRGCDINAQDCDGWTAMLYVMRANHGPGFTYIAKQFLDKGWDVNLRANDGTTALHMVMTMNLYETTEEVLRLLLDHGADATAQQDDGRTALQLLGSACSEEVLSMLEEAGCDPTATAKDGKNLLHDMAWHGDNWTAVLLAKGCDATARDQDGKTPLHYAAESSYDVTSLEQLINAGCDVAAAAVDGTTALHLAARNHNARSDELVKALLDGGADVQARDAEGRTPLHHAADLGQYHNEPHSLKRIRALIDAGADVNARSQDGWTPLHFAARCGALDVARLLLSSGGSCSAADEPCRYTALHLAANCSNSMGIGSDLSKRDLVRLLVQGGCGVDSRSLDGSTALHLAAQGGRRQVARLLVDAGADLRAVALAGGDSDIVHRNLVSDTVARQVVRELLDSGCTVDARDEDGKTALERAAIKMTKRDIRWLLGQKEE